MNTMKLNHPLVAYVRLFAFVGFLSGCGGSSDNHVPMVSMTLTDRQILSLNENRLLAEIKVNNGDTQKYFIEPDQTTIDIAVDGVRGNQNNTIAILWSEIYNEIAIELATQHQEVFGRGNIVIDAQHNSEGFDYDGDGVSNMAERLAGSCVWYTGNLCFLDGLSDLPTSPALSQGLLADTSFDYDNADDLVVNGHFTSGTDGWLSEYASLQSDGRELCARLESGPIPIQYPVIYTFVDLGPGSYSIEFDVKSTRREATLNVALYSSSLRQSLLYRFVKPLSLDWERRQVKFAHTGGQSRVAINFSGIINGSQPTTYCFDNVAVFKAR